MSLFRAIWPITDDAAGIEALIAQAECDLPILLAQAHAVITDQTRSRWSVARSVDIPGSGRVTERVLVFDAPAREAPVRPYWKKSAA